MKDVDRVILIPHVGKKGGAGLYIEQVVTSLKLSGLDVSIMGKHCNEYAHLDVQASHLGLDFSILNYPNYKGVNKLRLLKSLLFLAMILPLKLYQKEFSREGVYIITSSIQLPLGFLIKSHNLNSKVIVLIQENYRFDGFFGRISKYLVSKIDSLVSITEYWSSYARTMGYDPYTYSNKFFPEDNSSKDNGIIARRDYDFVYLGGGQKIKGFDDFIEFYRMISEVRRVKIAVLGAMSDFQNKQISLINNENKSQSFAVVFGFVSNPSFFLKASKILLLPISAPHFCRPAIEFGFYGKPFILRRHEGVQDFAIEGYNCLMYGRVSEFLDKAIFLLNDINERAKLGLNNKSVSRKFIFSYTESNDFVNHIIDVGKCRFNPGNLE
jgi:glycosyltransferase involved in cell wall biosynthesis